MIGFLLNPHPLFSSLLLLGFSFSVIFVINSFRSWFRFIIFLIYLGGILVLFVYIASISPNKKLHFFWRKILPLILLIGLVTSASKSFLNLNFSKILFYSPIFLKFWILFLCFLILILFILRDFSKKFFSTFRLV